MEISLVACRYDMFQKGNNKGADQTAGLCPCCSQTSKTGILRARPIYEQTHMKMKIYNLK